MLAEGTEPLPPAVFPNLRPDWRSRSFAIPTGLGLAAGLLVIGFSGATSAGVTCAVLLLVAGGVLGYSLSKQHRSDLEIAARVHRGDSGRLLDLCTKILPVWQRQVETSRESADDAVASLARNFSEMVEKLETTLSASRSATREIGAEQAGIVAIIRRSESELGSVVDSLKALQASKDTILAKVAEYAVDLREMAADVQQIALQIRLLSLNGAIEAARAGEAGQAFAVVVSEMRRLSGQSAELGMKISKKVAVVNAAVADMFGNTGESAGDKGTSIERAERDIGAVIERFKGLTGGLLQAVSVMENESEGLKGQISHALVDLQFQDRISQILGHVAGSMGTVSADVIRDPEARAGVGSWLAAMPDAFTTEEEFANLNGTGRTEKMRHKVRFF